MSAALLETFAAGNRIAKFAPQGPDDVRKRQSLQLTAITRSTSKMMVLTFSSIIHDGLTARAGVLKAYWMQQEEIDEQEFSDLTEAELDMVLAEDNVELLDSEVDEVGLVSGTIGVTRDTSQVMIEPIAPEDFLIEENARSMMDSKFCAHQTRKTLSELREMGFTDDQLDSIGEHNDVTIENDPEVLARQLRTWASRVVTTAKAIRIRCVMC